MAIDYVKRPKRAKRVRSGDVAAFIATGTTDPNRGVAVRPGGADVNITRVSAYRRT